MRIVCLVVHLFLVSILFAQTEKSLNLNQRKLYLPSDVAALTICLDDQFLKSESLSQFKSVSLDTHLLFTKTGLTKPNQLKSFAFSQEKTEEVFIGLGDYEHYKNNFTINVQDKLLINSQIGLVKQSTIQDIENVNLHLSMRTLIEYKFNKTLSAYAYGQYISSPLNKNNTSFDSYSYMNPLFLQTEAGTGIRANYKNFKTDVGMKSIRDNQFNQIKSISTMNTKITIGF